MAGIGKYKGEKFQLKSGNSPLAFKNMGGSPSKKDDEKFPGLLPEVEVKKSEHETARDRLARQAYKGISGPGRGGGTIEKSPQSIRSRAYREADKYIKKRKKNL